MAKFIGFGGKIESLSTWKVEGLAETDEEKEKPPRSLAKRLQELPEITLECEYNPGQVQLDMQALVEAAIRKQMDRLEKEAQMLLKAGFTPEELTIVQEGDGPQHVRPIREIE